MHAVIDINSPTETRNGRTTYSELTDTGYKIADRIDQWLDTHPGPHSPSQIGRAVGAHTHEARSILAWMHDRTMVAAAGNGTRRRYSSRRNHAHAPSQ